MQWQVRFLPLPEYLSMENNRYHAIPQVEKILSAAEIAAWFSVLSRPFVAQHVSDVLEAVRSSIRKEEVALSEEDIIRMAVHACRAAARKRIRRVINATGVILHTNMGRAPLASSVWEACAAVNTGYSNLELDLETGRRGKRNGMIPALMTMLTGAEDTLVVNNNAAAVLLMLSTFAQGKEVIVSRGEQIQIGGGFRIPEILALSGARLVEVGTTNITTVKDYASAITDDTAMVLIVHSSNFRIRGFTEKPNLRELASKLPQSVILAVDQGSGTITETVPGETRVHSYLKSGAALVSFSGDKILGGPQAGFLVGKKELINRMASHPLMRAFRPGKTIYSLMEEFLVQKTNGAATGHAERILSLSAEELRRFGKRILKGIPTAKAALVPSEITTGGGSSPDETLPSLSIELLSDKKPDEIVSSFRAMDVPIIATITEGKVRLSLATMYGEDPAYIRSAILAVSGE